MPGKSQRVQRMASLAISMTSLLMTDEYNFIIKLRFDLVFPIRPEHILLGRPRAFANGVIWRSSFTIEFIRSAF